MKLQPLPSLRLSTPYGFDRPPRRPWRWLGWTVIALVTLLVVFDVGMRLDTFVVMVHDGGQDGASGENAGARISAVHATSSSAPVWQPSQGPPQPASGSPAESSGSPAATGPDGTASSEPGGSAAGLPAASGGQPAAPVQQPAQAPWSGQETPPPAPGDSGADSSSGSSQPAAGPSADPQPATSTPEDASAAPEMPPDMAPAPDRSPPPGNQPSGGGGWASDPPSNQ